MEDEIWKPIPGYEGVYEVSDLGRVKSLERITAYSDGRKQWILKERVLRPGLSGPGYPSVVLYKNKVGRTHMCHQLVALAFLGERAPSMEVCHYDGDFANSKLSNLRYGSSKDNKDDQRRHGTRLKGSRVGSSVLLEEDIPKIREMANRFTSSHKYEFGYLNIGVMFGVSEGTIRNVVRGKTWKHVP